MTDPAALPPLYAAWMDDLLGSPIPAETNATCNDCAMVVPENTTGDAGYSAATKCCTFLPDLWNFLVGRILADEHPDAARGRASVEARIDRGIAVTPLRLGRTPTYQLLYDESPASFGHSRAMLCPHYIPEQGGLCGVWRHRESTCSTWFCKFVRGSVGREFWLQLHQLLRASEEAVGAWCLLELGVEHAVLSRLFRPHHERTDVKVTSRDMDGEPDAGVLRASWGAWRGRERDFYRECARLVDQLAWADVLRIGGAPLAVYARLTQDAHARLVSEAVPEHPVATLIQITPRGPNRVRLATYSHGDVLEVPSRVAGLLPYFDGRPTRDVLAELREREGVTVDPSFVRKLTDFGVLRDGSGA